MKPKPMMPTTGLLIAILIMVALRLLWPAGLVIPRGWNLLGILPLAAGAALNFVADQAFKRVGTTVKPFQESSALVENGAFAVSRNPMYLGFTLILLGLALLLRALSPFAVVIAFAVVLDRAYIAVEERMLQAKFGDDWAAYTRRVRRWV